MTPNSELGRRVCRQQVPDLQQLDEPEPHQQQAR